MCTCVKCTYTYKTCTKGVFPKTGHDKAIPRTDKGNKYVLSSHRFFFFFIFFFFFLSKHHDRKVWIHIRVWSTDIRITHVPDESIFPRTRWDKALIRTDHEKKKKLNAVSVIVFLLSAAFCFIQDITLYQFSVAWHMDIGMCWTRWAILGICSLIKMKCCRVSNCFYYPTSALAKPDLSVTRFACCCGSVFLPLSLSVYFHLLTRPCQWFSFCFPFSSQ